MASRTFNFPCFSGQTITIRMYTLSSATEVFQGNATELEGSDGEKLGRYAVTVTDVASGTYDWVAYDASGNPLINGVVDHQNATGTERDREHASVSDIWTTALTEAYRATGATGTAAQLLYEILQNLTEFALSGTTKTVKKLDGSTTAKTYALDNAITPTSISEST